LASNIGCRLCSEKLYDILERSKSKKDVLQWLDAEVESESGEKRRYYLLHFPEPGDLLDESKCMYFENNLVKHVLDIKACSGQEVFGYVGCSTVSFIVSQKVRDELKHARCSGLIYIRISPIKKSYLLNILGSLWKINKERFLNVFRGMKTPSVQNVNWDQIKGLDLPMDLIDFLEHNKSLCYNERKCRVGRVELVSIESLFFGRVYVNPSEESQKKGYYTISAVDLVAECEGYDAWGILLWLPDLHMFGAWDIDHRLLRVFPKAKWSDIVKKPIKYLNALWEPEQVENMVFVPNNKFTFTDEGRK